MTWFIQLIACGTEPAAPPVASPAPAVAPEAAPADPASRQGKGWKGKAKAGAAVYDESRGDECDTLPGDLMIGCTNGSSAAVCSDFPGELAMACEAGKLDPKNGKWFATTGDEVDL